MTNKDKLAIRILLADQVDNILEAKRDNIGYTSKIEHLDSWQIEDYVSKLLGFKK